ncbi:MAG: biopolymer transporter ExbD [Candidatus Eisenbacteria bacterium]
MSLRTSGRRKKRGGSLLEGEELNLLPLMSLFVALVPTLLYSAVFVPVSALGIDFPGTGGTASESPLALTVRLTETTVGLDGVPGRTYPQRDRTRDAGAGAMDSLRSELDALHGQYPATRGAILVVAPLVPYRDVVTVMDAVREAGFGNSTLLGAQADAAEPAEPAAP